MRPKYASDATRRDTPCRDQPARAARRPPPAGGAGPLVRIHFPPPERPLRTSLQSATKVLMTKKTPRRGDDECPAAYGGPLPARFARRGAFPGTRLSASPPHRDITAKSSPIAGEPLPPSMQPNVSKMSRRADSTVPAGRSAWLVRQTCWARAKAGSSVIIFIPRAAAAKLTKPLGDVALEPYAHEITGLRRRRDAARAPQCGLETQ
jgi:hypothetical protein